MMKYIFLAASLTFCNAAAMSDEDSSEEYHQLTMPVSDHTTAHRPQQTSCWRKYGCAAKITFYTVVTASFAVGLYYATNSILGELDGIKGDLDVLKDDINSLPHVRYGQEDHEPSPLEICVRTCLGIPDDT